MAQKQSQDPMISRLSGARWLARLAIAAERLWPLMLPLLLAASLFAITAWFGLFAMMGEPLRLAMLAGFGVAALAAASLLWRFRMPDMAEADRRLEIDNGLGHAPIRTQSDTLSGAPDAFADALWREHRRRMAARLGAVSPGLPQTRMPEKDPWALRSLAVLGLFTAFSFSFGASGGRLADAFIPRPAAASLPARIDAWVTPPAYTRLPPMFLAAKPDPAALPSSAPEGSVLTVRIAGGSGKETFAYGGVPLDGNAKTEGATEFTLALKKDGAAELSSGASVIASWAFTVIADNPPEIAFLADPKRGANGAFELNYAVKDDYGAASAKSEITVLAAPGAHPLYPAPEMALSLPRRGSADGKARAARDLTAHPFAGAEVSITLTALDDRGQSGRSAAKTAVLPERAFANPLARALVEQRRLLALDANAKPRILALMDAITIRPEDTIPVMAHYLGVTSARARLSLARDDDQLRAAADYLWEVALAIEEGSMTDAERRLAQAQQALKDALKNNASDEEIARLMDELRKAMDEFLKELAKNAPPQNADPSQQSQELRKNDLDRMMDQIENLAKSGAKDKAEQLLSQMQEMMKNLQAGRQQQGDQAANPMREQMNKLGDIMRRQQEMMNETHRLDQMQRGQRSGQKDRAGQQGEGEENPEGQGREQGQSGQGGEGQPQSPGPNGMSAEDYAEALRQMQDGQGQLEGELGQMMKDLEGMGIKPGEGFGEAGRSMGKAGDALGDAEGEQAVGEQGRALEALRRGANDMMQQMRQAQQGQQGGSQQGGLRGGGKDPLGRGTATDGPDFGESVDLPDEVDAQRAREILEAIRKRLGDALSPELEKEYLERLLENR